MYTENESSSHSILVVAEEELNNIVLNIHDGPVQYLFAALSLLNGLQQQIKVQLPGCSETLPTLSRIAQMVEGSLQEIRSFLGTFRPPEFHRRELASIIEELVIQHEEWTGSTVELSIEALPVGVSLPVKIALYRILQEALSNAHRHSGVKQQRVKLWSEGEFINMGIVDDGVGFSPPALDKSTKIEREEHIGLRGMSERVKLLNGKIEISSQPGKGTQIMIRVPTHKYSAKETQLVQFE